MMVPGIFLLTHQADDQKDIPFPFYRSL
jgi:hypothetical protein